MTALPIRVVSIDDHPLVREGIESMIRWHTDLQLVASGATGEQAIELFHRFKPDVTLMDLHLPRMSGLDAVRAIRQVDSGARVIVLTMYERDEDIFRALQAGASTYLIKDVTCDELAQVIRRVHAGERPLSPDLRRRLDERFDESELTPRELEVLKLMADGLTNTAIAAALRISQETAKMHVHHVLSKLRVANRSAAVSAAARRGLIHL
ncbi:MAG: response regulator transcription factor [Acidimicrobiia bacterium]|nr:response regulator transcription factor [Acidimicrobiia bacterium]